MDSHHEVPVLDGHLEQQVVADDAGVVDEDRRRAEFSDDGFEGGINGRRVADVGANGQRGPTSGADRVGSALGGVGAQVEQRHLVSVSGEAQADGRTNALSATGDDGGTWFSHLRIPTRGR